jgi:hypothetical protein
VDTSSRLSTTHPTNKHAASLGPLLHRETDAAEVLAILRRQSLACVNVVNTNILAAE